MQEEYIKQSQKLCKVCKNAIPHDAEKCTHCSEWQFSLTRYMNIGVPVLSLLVALLALIMTGHKEIRSFIFGPEAIKLVGASEPLGNEETIFTFTNDGDQATRIERIECSWELYTDTLIYDLRIDLEPKINPIIRPQQTIESRFFIKETSWSHHKKGEWELLDLTLGSLFSTSANACCGEPIAACTVFHQDGSDQFRENKFSTNRMRVWYDKIAGRFAEKLQKKL
jgi:predicted nucleic acid-binding Zn ribbon protein